MLILSIIFFSDCGQVLKRIVIPDICYFPLLALAQQMDLFPWTLPNLLHTEIISISLKSLNEKHPHNPYCWQSWEDRTSEQCVEDKIWGLLLVRMSIFFLFVQLNPIFWAPGAASVTGNVPLLNNVFSAIFAFLKGT